MFRRIFFSGQLYFWIIWLFLLAIYFDTIYHTGDYRNAILVLILLVILYFAEGMEIAVATLADKQIAQIELERARKALAFIKKDAEWFFAQRQVFVVTIVSFMSLMTTFQLVYVPFYKALGSNDLSISLFSWTLLVDVPFWFTLVFTSFTILWWCQVFPKRLALRNSEIFLHQSSMLMGPIRGIGAINLPGPADQLVWFATKFTSYRQLSSLKPSRDYYYDTAVMLYGFAVDRAVTQITIKSDGSAVIFQRALLLFIHGRRSLATGRLSADSAFLSVPNIQLKSLHSCPVPEKLEMIRSQLDAIFDGHAPGLGQTTFASHQPDVQTMNFNLGKTFVPPAPGPNQNAIGWTIDWGPPLPNSLRNPGTTARQNPILAALVYEVSTSFGPSAFRKDDRFTWNFEIPCRRITFKVAPEVSTRWGFEIVGCKATARTVPFPDETERATKVIQDVNSSEFNFDHPLQGTAYDIEWRGWPI
jgi:hypothetical protein